MIEVTRLGPGDHVETVPISIAAFPASFHPLLLHCQPGYDRYIETLLTSPVDSGRDFWVARDDGVTVGFAEWREVGDDRLLNHIAVAPSHQGQGVGRSLLGRYVEQSDATGRLLLDVFSDEPARGFYASLGFTTEAIRTWALRSAPSAAPRVLSSPDLHVLAATLDRYGFGMVNVRDGDRTWVLGFSSRTTVRVPSADAFLDDGLLASIAAAFPGVTTFVHIATEDAPRGDRPSLTAERMSRPTSRPIQWCPRLSL